MMLLLFGVTLSINVLGRWLDPEGVISSGA